MIDTKTNPFDAIDVIEDEIKDALEDYYLIADDEIDANAMGHATDVLVATWDGDGWYEVNVGIYTWGEAACYYGDRETLGAEIYRAASNVGRPDDAWVRKVTDADEIAELELEEMSW